VSLDDAIDELYGAAPEDFVTERTRLVKALRDAGLRDAALALSKLRKPSIAAWALNQLARARRREVDLLLDSGHRLREAQAGLFGGGEKETFETARRAEQDALSQLIAAAEELLRERGSASAATVAQVRESLRAAAVSPEGRELLARGRFTEPIRLEGFDLLGELAASAPRPRRRPPRPRHNREALEQAKAALRDARARLRAAEQEAAAAEVRVEAARKALAEAETKLRLAKD
jgi:hypothetical protein